MKVKSAYTILCLCMILGIFTGCAAKEKEAKVLPDAGNSAVLETIGEAAIEIMGKETSESASETINAVGMSLMDNTALLATIETPSGKISRQYEYDKEGHMLRYLNMIDDYMWEFEYDSAGNLRRETDWHFGDGEWKAKDRKLSSQTEYVYDGAGRQLSWTERRYQDDGSLERCFVYAASGQQAWEMNYFYRDGKLESQIRYEYDDMGNLIKTTVYGYEGGELTYEKYTYDDAGHLIKEEGIDGDPIIGEYMEEYTYNEKGRLVGSFTSTNTEIYGDEYEYDDNGNCVGKLDRYFERDEAGNVSECAYSPSIAQENQYDERNRLMRVYYAYDDTTYDYTYETIGVLDEDYPYDKIEIYGKIGELWYGGRIIQKELK